MPLRQKNQGSRPEKKSLVHNCINFPLAKLNKHPGNSHLSQGPEGATDSWLQKGTLLCSGHSTFPLCAAPSSQNCPYWVLPNWTVDPVHPDLTASQATSKAVVATSLKEVLLPLYSEETPSGVLCPAQGSPSEERQGTFGAGIELWEDRL